MIPDRCEIVLSARLLPGCAEDRVLERLRKSVDGELEIGGASPPMLLGVDTPIHRTLCELTGQSAGTGVSYATDAGWLASAGLECAVWGPGSIERAHRPNEFIAKSELAAARNLLAKVIDRFCGAGE